MRGRRAEVKGGKGSAATETFAVLHHAGQLELARNAGLDHVDRAKLGKIV